MADIRNPTCFKTRISIPIRFSKDQGCPGYSAFCLTPVGILCTRLPKSGVFQCSAVPGMQIQIKVKLIKLIKVKSNSFIQKEI